MTDYNLLPEAAFENLPEDPGEQFLLLLRIIEANFNLKMPKMAGSELDSIRRQFVDQVKVISKELNISGLEIVSSGTMAPAEFRSFQNGLVPIRSRIHLRRAIRQKDSVQLGVSAKAHIEIEIERLRNLVNSSDLPQSKKDRIGDKLDELLEELRKRRLGFARLLAIAASVAGLIGGTASGLANGPEALERIGIILHWVGREIAAENAEQLRLSGPLRALPAPSAETPAESDDPAAPPSYDQNGENDALEP